MSGFSGGQLELTDPAAPVQGGKRTIAKLENTFQVGVGPKKFNPSRCAVALINTLQKRSSILWQVLNIRVWYSETSHTLPAGFYHHRTILKPMGTASSWLHQRCPKRRCVACSHVAKLSHLVSLGNRLAQYNCPEMAVFTSETARAGDIWFAKASKAVCA